MHTQPRSDSVASTGSTGATTEGFLLKRSGKKLVKWRKRWFTLRTEVLLYYQTEKSLQTRGNMDLSECRGLRKHTEIRKIKNLPKSAEEQFVFGIATKKKVFVVCAPDIVSYNDWTWSLHRTITQCNPDVVQLSLGTFIGNKTDPFLDYGDDYEFDRSDESSSEDEAFLPTREESKLDIQTLRSSKRPGSKQGMRGGPRVPDKKEERVRLVQTPEGLNFSNNKTGTELKSTSKWVGPRVSMKNRFNAGTDWRESSHSAPTTPVSSKKITKWGQNPGKKQTDPSGTDSKHKRISTPLGAVSSKVRSSISKLNVSGSMTDLRDILRPQSSMGAKSNIQKGPPIKRSSSGNVADEEARAVGALQECLQEVEMFKEQIEKFLGRKVLVEQDLTRMVEDRSLHQNGFRRFKGLRETIRSVLQNLLKGLVSVAEPEYVRVEAARVLAKFQFTLFQIPFNPNSLERPASSLMLQCLRGRELEWECPDPPADCSLHYYLQLQLGEAEKRTVDIMTVFQCEVFWENLLRGKESKYSLQIETGVAKWQMDLEKLLGRRIGMFVDTTELLKQVPEQTLRYKAAEGVGNNFCQESLGRLVGILEKLVDNQLTQKQLKKRLRYIELGPLPPESEEDKVVKWRDGGLVVLAKWYNGVKIQYADVFQCFESENAIN